ncbi:hypothetical protein E1218_19490 [Kribbella turkmenica]|uniref:Uncharacterized protein n=1 Tax=Kribbella turkmenica TaxID=2530375 RepID=A0A4V2YF94_9ACTN|nr:hypothetical protein E1218_19490 [Kribbella turkmenica]
MPWADEADPANHFAIRTVQDAHRRGYGTALSLKFPFADRALPAAGSPELAAELARLDKVLPLLVGTVDILAIGNEPFIESRPAERDERLNVFYEAVADHVIAYRREHCGERCPTRLYMGALNRLDLPDRLTPAAERWMTFVRETPELEGVDIHPHVPSVQAVQPFLDYVLPRLRPDQKFLVTEFSLVWLWKAHLGDTIPVDFAQRYGYAPDTKVWEVIRAATENPFSQRKWNDFLAASPWYEANKDFLREQVQRFRDTGRLAFASYGFRQDALMVRDFQVTSSPWLLNSVFAPYTVQPDADGLTGQGYSWLDDFRALQRGHGHGHGDRPAAAVAR